jgi:2-hydroxychromene-2-carboxylate isomerase
VHTPGPAIDDKGIDFWFDFASPYSYLAAARLFTHAEDQAEGISWRPMLFGAILRDQGFTTSPFNTQPAKSRHMWRDVARRAAPLGLTIRRPEPFPQGSLHAARVMLVGLDEGWGRDFAMAVFAAGFEHGFDIGDAGVIAACIRLGGGDDTKAMALAGSDSIKQRLRADTHAASAAGVFGAPSFAVDSELFWGDDRLDEALAWRRGDHPFQLLDKPRA